MLLFDLSHTSHSQARTGVQRVTLELRRALKNITSVEDITHDPYRRHWRPLQSWETRTLETVPGTAKRRGAYWPLRKQLRAWIDRNLHTSSTSVSLPKNTSGFLTTEIFTARTGQNLPDLFERLTGPKVAMFHDAISLRMPHLA
ncbi:MAG: glycosyltransferase, partial [Verrucomicrobiia bacterium]